MSIQQTLSRRSVTSLGRRPDIMAQALLLAALAAAGWWIWIAASTGMGRLTAGGGFDFLFSPASFELGESLLPFHAGDTYLRAFAAGLSNTLKVSVLSIVLSTLIGLLVALGQLSPSIVIARICRTYVEAVRNVPLLLQLIFWHTLLTRGLPSVRQAMSPVEGVYLSNRGLFLPAPVVDSAFGWMSAAIFAGICSAVLIRWRGGARSWRMPALWAALLLPPIAAFAVTGMPLTFEVPTLAGFNFKGGMALTPEFVAMLAGLSIYVGAFNAEIIRSGILSVSPGQREAGLALGLSSWQVMRKIILPQALRIILPSLTNSYLNATKESSLAVAIGYPDLVRVSNMALGETGRPIECIAIIMAVYLCLSLLTSLTLNWLNARARLVER